MGVDGGKPIVKIKNSAHQGYCIIKNKKIQFIILILFFGYVRYRTSEIIFFGW